MGSGFAVWVRALTALLVAALLLVATGCGTEEPPASTVPELASLLEEVDAAVVAGDRGLAAERVAALVETTEEARDSGELSDEQADPIVAAAERLLGELPDPPAEPPADNSTPPSPEEAGETDETDEPEDEPEEEEEEEVDGEEQDDAPPGSTKAGQKSHGKATGKGKAKNKP